MRFENNNGKCTFNGREIKSPALRLVLGIISVLVAALIVALVLAVLLPLFGPPIDLSVGLYVALVIAVLVILPTLLAGSLLTGIVSGSIDLFSTSKSKIRVLARKNKQFYKPEFGLILDKITLAY